MLDKKVCMFQSPEEVHIDITPIATDIVEDIIDEVMKSTNREPSVPAVVLDTMQSIIEEEEENQMVDDQHGDDDEAREEQKARTDAIKAEMEEMRRQTSVSEIISNFEAKDKDDTERKSVSPKTSPRRSISPDDVYKNRINSSEERSIEEEEGESSFEEKNDASNEKNRDIVTVKSVSGKTDNVVTVSNKQEVDNKHEKENKREMEIQAVKVKIDDDESMTTDIDDVITINGQPVPASRTVVINGHVTRIQNTPQRDADKHRSPDREIGKAQSPDKEIDKGKEKSLSPVINNKEKDHRKDSKGFIQQTDLDTFETKITNDVEPSEVSNLDEDSSDQKSDTGSINTVDSVDKDERNESSTPKKARRLKNRNVSRFDW